MAIPRLDLVSGMNTVIMPIQAVPSESAVPRPATPNSVLLPGDFGNDLWFLSTDCAYLEPTRVMIRLLL